MESISDNELMFKVREVDLARLGLLYERYKKILFAFVKMKSDHGEIYTDFDMNISKKPPKVGNKQESGEYKISMEEWVNGSINKGGPLISFKTFNGDILIRKRKS